MANLTRRFFLGGAISLLAVQTSAMPKIIGNMPQIWGDNRHDDTSGIGTLLRNEPVVFTKDKITVDAHDGIAFHGGIFRVSRTIDIPDECKLSMDSPTFRAFGLPENAPFFRSPWGMGSSFSPDTFVRVWFKAAGRRAPDIEFPKFDADAEFERDMLSLAQSRAAAA